MAKKKAKEEKGVKALRVKSTGESWNGDLLVNLYLIDGHGGTGQTCLLYAVDRSLVNARKLAEWFGALGVPVEWVDSNGQVVANADSLWPGQRLARIPDDMPTLF